jgi:hypothetical protein
VEQLLACPRQLKQEAFVQPLKKIMLGDVHGTSR